MKILFAASEIFPYAKTGGLADVAQALPNSLKKHVDICCVMPMYGFMNSALFKKSGIEFKVELGDNTHAITLYSADNRGVKTYFVHTPLFSDSDELYSDHSGSYENSNPNFGIFCAAVAELANELNVDILHLNDWHSALAAFFIKEGSPDIKTIYTIHNLAYQGIFDPSMMEYFGIDEKYFTMDALEFYSRLSFMKAGIAFSDVVTTVSKQYAKEILSERFGCGLHTFLKEHQNKLFGIVNGIDFELFDPQSDKALVSNFCSKETEQKYLNKDSLIKEFSFKDSKRALFIMVSRLVHQKGFDLLLEALDEMLALELNLVILVDGVNNYRQRLQNSAKKYENLHLLFGYDEDTSHRLYAGADFLLMPSVFEPCGLNQMIAMRYGTIPIVHGVGGLIDTVHENKSECGEGVVFCEYTKEAFLSAIDRGLWLYKQRDEMQRIIRFNMECDFSFDSMALSYLDLYKRMVS